jgi:hypothetical protein
MDGPMKAYSQKNVLLFFALRFTIHGYRGAPEQLKGEIG